MRPRIAITTWRRALPTFLGEETDLYTLGAEYVISVAVAGTIPVLLPHLDPADVDEVLDAVDGLVVAGGGDVHPASYDAENTASKETDAGADASELALLRRARNRGVPTLAICRGMQLTNVAFGGTLQQDIGVAESVHEPVSDDPDEVLAAMHPVDVVADSRLGSIVGGGQREVNTIHHQAIDRLAAGFRVVAWAPDGIIEAIEAEGPWPLVAVQWHPEKRAGHDDALFDWLAAEARAYRRASQNR